MVKDPIIIEDDQYSLDFLAKENQNEIEHLEHRELKPYKILIADDEKEMHTATKLLLKNFKFEGHSLVFLDTYSGEETIKLLKETEDIAVILLDVVMESNDAGLKVVDFIRNIKKDPHVRIVLRTGQPGEAPEEKIIELYDINDYRLKTELTTQRLFTTLYESLRSYRDLMTLKYNRDGLEKIITMSSGLFTKQSIEELYSCILEQLLRFKEEDSSALYFREKRDESGLIFTDNLTFGTIIAATGRYAQYLGLNIEAIDELGEILARNTKQIEPVDDFIKLNKGYLIYKSSPHGVKSYIYIESTDFKFDINLIKIYLTNYSLALDNFMLTQQILSTQKEIIRALGDTIESRSTETGEHVNRVTKLVVLIAEKMNLSTEMCKIIEVASVLHDVGKIGIPDSILLKPTSLTPEEFEIVKKHTEIGYKLLIKSNLEILNHAATIARYHHERYDGTGYPMGLIGEEIPITARIVSLVDVFDALTHYRVYKSPWTFDDAVEYIKQNSGTQFDEKIVAIFIQHLDAVREIYLKNQ